MHIGSGTHGKCLWARTDWLSVLSVKSVMGLTVIYLNLVISLAYVACFFFPRIEITSFFFSHKSFVLIHVFAKILRRTQFQSVD